MFKKLINKIFGEPNDTMSFMESMNLIGLPVVTFFQGDKRFNFLLDTGSNRSIIDANILPQLKHGDIIKTNNSLTGLGGTYEGLRMCSISFYYKDKEYPYDEYLIQDMKAVFDSIKEESGVKLHGILGATFFNKFKYILDFNKLIAYSKGCRNK
nr:MAG TPA: hypothetical protein [Caudoviricetes sp.]